MPPRVPGLPFVGNLFQLDPVKPHLTLTEFHKKHGDVYTLHILGEDIVQVGSYEAIKEATMTKQDEFGGRPLFWRIKYANYFIHDGR